MPIRKARAEDITAAIEVGKLILDRSVIQGELNPLYARKAMLRCINDKSMAMWVAERKGKVVGFLMAIKEQHWFSADKYAADICFCIHPTYKGFGSGMVHKFIEWAKSDPKVKDINLAISSGLDTEGRAGQMYQKLGFAQVGGVYSYSEGKSPCQD